MAKEEVQEEIVHSTEMTEEAMIEIGQDLETMISEEVLETLEEEIKTVLKDVSTVGKMVTFQENVLNVNHILFSEEIKKQWRRIWFW